jgi:hypothetical protein
MDGGVDWHPSPRDRSVDAVGADCKVLTSIAGKVWIKAFVLSSPLPIVNMATAIGEAITATRRCGSMTIAEILPP